MSCNFNTTWKLCQPISHLKFLNSLFGCLVVGCLRGRYRGTQKCHTASSPKFSVVFGRPEELSKPPGHWLGMTKGEPRPDPNHEEKHVSLIVENQGRADQMNWVSCFCPHGPKTFGSSWVSPKTSSQMHQTDIWSPQPPTLRMGTQAPELEPSALVSSDIWCPGSAFTTLMVVPEFVDVLVGLVGCCLQETDWNVSPSLLVWGAFHASGKSEPVVASGTVNQHWHFAQNLLRWARANFQKKIVFVDDNATPHAAQNTLNFSAGEEVEVMQWPARSPDLSPIEHIWDQMGRFIKHMDSPPTTVARLREPCCKLINYNVLWIFLLNSHYGS